MYFYTFQSFRQTPKMDEDIRPTRNALTKNCYGGSENSMQELGCGEIRKSLESLSLASVRLGDYLVVMKSDFDVFIDGEPYIALMLLWNQKSGVYKVKLWNQIIATGNNLTLEQLMQICKEYFWQGKPCIGFPIYIKEEHGHGQCVLSQTPVPRKISQDCRKFLSAHDDNYLCSECKSLSVSNMLKNVTVLVNDDETTVTDNEIGPGPNQEQEKDYLYTQDSTDDNYDTIESSVLQDKDVLKSDDKSLSKRIFKNLTSKECPWCNKTITWSGNTDSFEKHRTVCLLVLLKKNTKNHDSDTRLKHDPSESQVEDESEKYKRKCLDPVKEVSQGRNTKVNNSSEGAELSSKESSMNDQTYCQDCKKYFKSKACATLHKKFVHFWGIFHCPTCNEQVNFAEDLVHHMQQGAEHEKNQTPNCPACKKEFTVTNIAEHYKRCVVDEVAREKFAAIGEGMQPPKIQNIQTKYPKVTKHNSSKAHINVMTYCFDCERDLNSEATLTLHKKFVHFWGVFKCLECTEKFNFADHLIKHIENDNTHDNNIKIDCPECKVDLPFSEIAIHYKKCVVTEMQRTKYVSNNPELILSEPKFVPKNGERVICSLCGKSFKSMEILSRHNRIHLREQGAKVPETGSMPLYFNCEYCGKLFVSKTGVDKHTKIVHEGKSDNAVCETCGITFLTTDRLWRHNNMHHSNDDTYSCKYCNKRCSTRPWLARHIASKHEEPKYKCSDCGKLFWNKRKLDKHENEHKGVKPYSCVECGLSYTSKDGLSSHKAKKNH